MKIFYFNRTTQKTSLYFFLTLSCLTFKNVLSSTKVVADVEPEIEQFNVAKLDFAHVADAFSITTWILLGSLAKMAFHSSSDKLTEKIPESCLLVILGLIVGVLFHATKKVDDEAYLLNANTFFIYLLPPIILEAGYFMPNRSETTFSIGLIKHLIDSIM